MAPTRHPRYRAAMLTLAYVFLCVAGSIAQIAFSRIEDAASQADDATSTAAEALDRAEENELEISELKDMIEDLHRQVEYR